MYILGLVIGMNIYFCLYACVKLVCLLTRAIISCFKSPLATCKNLIVIGFIVTQLHRHLEFSSHHSFV
jgi:hypothetical protein